jgi:hypothetical protein
MSDRMTGGAQWLARVREGMAVRDAAGERIGTVRSVRMGEGGDPADARQQAREAIAEVQAAIREPDRRPLDTGDVEAVGVGGLAGDGGRPIGPLTGAVNDPDVMLQHGPGDAFGAMGPDDDLPDSGRDRLLQQGYIRIDSAGLFASDRYATADQIAQVGNDGVHLTVDRDALMTAR